MDLEKYLIIGLLFTLFVFIFSPLETAITAISGTEALKPIFEFIPYALVGSLFLVIIYVGLNR